MIKSLVLFIFERKVKIDGKVIEKELPLSCESEGTQKIFWFLVSTLENMQGEKIFLTLVCFY